MDMAASERSIFQFHLSTAIILMLIAAVFVRIDVYSGWRFALVTMPVSVCILFHTATLIEARRLWPSPIAGMPEPCERRVVIPPDRLEEFQSRLTAATVSWSRSTVPPRGRGSNLSQEIMGRIGSDDFELSPRWARSDSPWVLAGSFCRIGPGIEVRWSCKSELLSNVWNSIVLGAIYLGLCWMCLHGNPRLPSSFRELSPFAVWSWGVSTMAFAWLYSSRERNREALLRMETLVYSIAAEVGGRDTLFGIQS
jgi:hypothetical protein